MSELIQAVLESEEKSDLRSLFSELRHQEKRYLLRNEILSAYADYCAKYQTQEFYNSSQLGKLIYYTQEIIVEGESLYLIIRPKIASQEVYRITAELNVESIDVQTLLDLRDRLVNRFHPNEGEIFIYPVNYFKIPGSG